MIIDAQSWHYRLMYWAYGERYFFKHDWDSFYRDAMAYVPGQQTSYPNPDQYQVRKPVALCPYVDRLILAVVAFPLFAVWRTLGSNGKLVMVQTGIGLFLGFVWVFRYGLVAIPIGVLGSWGLGGLVWLLLSADDYWSKKHPHKDKESEPKPEPKVKAPKSPNIFLAWLGAKHRKVCPYLQFENEKYEGRTTSL